MHAYKCFGSQGNIDSSVEGKEKKRKAYTSEVQLRALRKGSLPSKLARASPRLRVTCRVIGGVAHIAHQITGLHRY
eukprot:498476-Pelagomonas_calceolata.AAC.4